MDIGRAAGNATRPMPDARARMRRRLSSTCQALIIVARRCRVERRFAAWFVVDGECRFRMMVPEAIFLGRTQVSSGLHSGNDLAERRKEHRREGIWLGWNESSDIASHGEVALFNSSDLCGNLGQRRAILQSSEHFDSQQERRVEHDLQLLLCLDESAQTFEGIFTVGETEDFRAHLAAIGDEEAAVDIFLARN